MGRVEETNADDEAVKCAGRKRKLFAFEKRAYEHTDRQTHNTSNDALHTVFKIREIPH